MRRVLAGHPRAELVVLLAEATTDQGDETRWQALVSEAVRLLRPDTEPLLASRVYSALGDRFHRARRDSRPGGGHPTGHPLRRRPAERGACAGAGRPVCLPHGRERLQRNLSSPPPGPRTSLAAVGATEVLADALRRAGFAAMALGRFQESIALARESVEVSRRAGFTGRAIYDVGNMAWALMIASHVEEGLELARRGYQEGLALGLPVQATSCGEQMQTALTWLGRLDESELLSDPAPRAGVPRAPLALAAGGAVARPGRCRSGSSTPAGDHSTTFADSAATAGTGAGCGNARPDPPRPRGGQHASWRRSRPATRPWIRPRPLGSGSRRSLSVGRCLEPRPTACYLLSDHHLAVAQAGLTDDWRTSYDGVQLALAAAYAARVADRSRPLPSSATQLFSRSRSAPSLPSSHASTSPRSCWHTEAATRAANCSPCAGASPTRSVPDTSQHRAVPARHAHPGAPARKASQIGPLNRLTAREREVLDLLATGATNKTIAGRLFITRMPIAE